MLCQRLSSKLFLIQMALIVLIINLKSIFKRVYWLFGSGFTKPPRWLSKNAVNLEEPVVNEVVPSNESELVSEEDLFNSTLDHETAKENEIEFEINLSSTPESDIQIVEKPRVNLKEEMEERETVNSSQADSQFSLFETHSDRVSEEMDDQQLERDLIKKRITLDMHKHNISLYELEKEPAYKRYGMELDNSMPSEQSNFSDYMIYNNSEDPGKIEIRPNAMKDITLD